MSYKKLVRDKIPEIIEASGEKPVTRVLDDEEFRAELIKKLGEEVAEFIEDPSLGERADIAEVLKKLDVIMGFTPEMIERARANKAIERGGFEDKIYLEGIE